MTRPEPTAPLRPARDLDRREDDWMAVERVRTEVISLYRFGHGMDRIATALRIGNRRVRDLLGREYLEPGGVWAWPKRQK